MGSKTYKLVLTKEASDDIFDLFESYQSYQEGLGDIFMDHIEICLAGILENPYRWQFAKSREDGIRRAIVKKPVSIILYELDGETIFIGSVHDSRSDWMPK